MAFEFISQQLAQQQAESRYRQRICVAEQSGRALVVNGKSYLNFSSNDYLGLNNHSLINKAMQEGIDKFGISASASSLITGYHYAHQALEADICQWLNKPKCLLFTSGFAANSGIFQALGQTNSHFWLDKLSHASMIDGALASKAKLKRFRHNDITQLKHLLANNENLDHIIASEGVFSMDGDQADVVGLADLAKQHSALLYLDDAHSIGVIGEQGQGSVSLAPADIVMATFGKAIASSGAFVACNEQLFEYFVNFSRHYIYSTAMSPALAWATRKSINIIQTEQWRRDKIIELSALLRQSLTSNIKLIATSSSIHALVVGNEKSALLASEKLKAKGIWLTAIRPPTVPRGECRLRVTICASHNVNDIKYLSDNLNEIFS